MLRSLRSCFRPAPPRAADLTSSTQVNSNVSDAAACTIAVDSDEGSCALKIAGYSKTKQLINTGEYAISRPFSVAGHAWVLKYYPNGTKDADFVSVYLLLQSERAQEVRATCTFSALDKDGEPVPSFSSGTAPAVTFRQEAYGYSRFLKKADLEGSPHLIDDCFTIRCHIIVLKGIRNKETKRKQFVVVPPSNLGLHLGGLLNSKDGADITFHVGGDKFQAHRSVLAARSSVFKVELFGSMKENVRDPVEIDDMDSDVFKTLLHFIYTDKLPEMTHQDLVMMADRLLVAADRYGLERAKLICKEKLCDHIDSDIVATSLTLAEQHSCSGLKDACFEFLASPCNFEAMVATDGYKHLKSNFPSVLKELIAEVFLPAKLKSAKDIIMTI